VTSGCNLGYRGHFDLPRAQESLQTIRVDGQEPLTPRVIDNRFKDLRGRIQAQLAWVVALGILFLSFFVGGLWLCAAMNFALMAAVTERHVSIRQSIAAYRPQIAAYFAWLLGVAALGLGVLSAAGMRAWNRWREWVALQPDTPFDQLLGSNGDWLVTLLGWAGIGMAAGLAGWIYTLLERDYMLPLLYRRRGSLFAAWAEALGIVRADGWEAAKYAMARTVLGVVGTLGTGAALVAIVALCAVVAALLILLGSLIVSLIPVLKLPLAVLAIIGAFAGILGFIGLCFFLPAPASLAVRLFTFRYLDSINQASK
jgi:hypothetical protein